MHMRPRPQTAWANASRLPPYCCLPQRLDADHLRLVGDVAFDQVQPMASRITPNPGGVGPMTISMLMHNTVRAAELAVARRS